MLIVWVIGGVLVLTVIVALIFSFFRQPETVDSDSLIPKGMSRAEYERKFELNKSYRITGIKKCNESSIERH